MATAAQDKSVEALSILHNGADVTVRPFRVTHVDDDGAHTTQTDDILVADLDRPEERFFVYADGTVLTMAGEALDVEAELEKQVER